MSNNENETLRKDNYIKIAQLPNNFYSYVDDCIRASNTTDSSIAKIGEMQEWHILDVDHMTGFGLYEKGLLCNIRCFRYEVREEDLSNERMQMGAWIMGKGDQPSIETLRKMIDTPFRLLREKIPFEKIKSIVYEETVSSVNKQAILSLNEDEDAILYIDYHNTQGWELRIFIELVRDVLKSRVPIYILSIS